MGYEDIVEHFLQNGENVDTRDHDGSIALHHSVENGYPRIVEMLIRAGTIINIQNRYQETPLVVASSSGPEETLKILISHQPDVNLVDYDGHTALHWTSRSGRFEL